MYAQFFGNYLLNRNAVTPEQLAKAIANSSNTHIKLGTLAMHKGFMTAAEVDEVCFLQTREDKRFGEIAIERNYLFEDQLEDLLKSQNPDFLLLGQNLVDTGALSNGELEELIIAYQNDYEIITPTDRAGTEDTQALIENFLISAERPVDEHAVMYLNLVFNNLVRFIGDDFTPLSPIQTNEYEVNYCVTQNISGAISFSSSLDMETKTAIGFASRYAKMEFTEFDEYVKASLEDFLNLHNGLFTVNMSNDASIELTLDPPHQEMDPVLTLSDNSFVIPVIYPFGTIYLLLTL